MQTDPPLWASPEALCPPPRDEVHVWRVPISQAAPAAAVVETALSAEEAARAARFRFDKDRLTYVLGRGLLRSLLGRYLHTPPGNVRFATNEHGKPGLAAEAAGSGLQFNLSHSGDWIVYAVARDRAVGIDVERVRPFPNLANLARRFFSAGEVAALFALPDAQRQEAFFHCWARKEAYIKAVGGGLSIPLGQFEVSLAPDEPARLVDARGEAAAAGPWDLRELALGPGYAAAIAVHGAGWRLCCRG